MPALERALRRSAAGETLLASGVTRITTAAGTTYCMKTQSAAVHIGPLEPMAVPMTCP